MKRSSTYGYGVPDGDGDAVAVEVFGGLFFYEVLDHEEDAAYCAAQLKNVDVVHIAERNADA